MRKRILIVLAALAGSLTMNAQKEITLDLSRTIELANDSSLEAFRSQNMYLAGYWEYRSYKANRLPSLTLNLTPAEYNRDITKRYDSENDIDVYRTQRTFSASGGLSIVQNLDLLGGTFYIDSDLEYLRSFGDSPITQYTSVPVRIGYRQELLGYNAFKWERRIEPLKYERVKKQFIYNLEQVSEIATSRFFELAMAQAEYDLAKRNLTSADTLYKIGKERYEIAAISKEDLLTLRLDYVNATNSLQTKNNNLKRASFSLASFLNLDKNTIIHATLPTHPKSVEIPIDRAVQMVKENSPQILQMRQSILESRRSVDKARKESMFNARINASVGYNQAAEDFRGAYRNLLRQDLVSVSVSIPLVDWGVRKGRLNMARNNLNVNVISAQQEEIKVEQEVLMTINDFNIQQQQLASAEEALDLAIMAYQLTRERFIIGKADINSLTLSTNRQNDAQRNYISSLQRYWENYYKIRRLTLYDFVNDFSLSDRFDFSGGHLAR